MYDQEETAFVDDNDDHYYICSKEKFRAIEEQIEKNKNPQSFGKNLKQVEKNSEQKINGNQ